MPYFYIGRLNSLKMLIPKLVDRFFSELISGKKSFWRLSGRINGEIKIFYDKRGISLNLDVKTYYKATS